jgi:hypothetical protein
MEREQMNATSYSRCSWLRRVAASREHYRPRPAISVASGARHSHQQPLSGGGALVAPSPARFSRESGICLYFLSDIDFWQIRSTTREGGSHRLASGHRKGATRIDLRFRPEVAAIQHRMEARKGEDDEPC